MPPAQVNTLNCLILESKNSLRMVPPHFQTYFINSKRRFFLYFRIHRQMLQAMQLFTENGVRFYQRSSLLPDREELEEQVFHCNYKFKRADYRRNLHHSTPYNEPKLHFDRFDRARIKFEALPKREEANEEIADLAKSASLEEKEREEKDVKGQKQPEEEVEQRQRQEAQQMQIEVEMEEEKKVEPIVVGYQYKNPEIQAILQNKELMRSIFLSFSFERIQ